MLVASKIIFNYLPFKLIQKIKISCSTVKHFSLRKQITKSLNHLSDEDFMTVSNHSANPFSKKWVITQGRRLPNVD